MKIKDEEKLVKILEKSPRDLGLNCDFWTLKLVAYVLEREFWVKYNPRSLGPVLNKLDFKYKKVKRTYVRDEKAVEGWVREQGERLFKKIAEGYKVHVFVVSPVNKGWMKAGAGVKVNPKRKRFAVIGGIMISKAGITFTYSTYKKPSLNSEDIILEKGDKGREGRGDNGQHQNPRK